MSEQAPEGKEKCYEKWSYFTSADICLLNPPDELWLLLYHFLYGSHTALHILTVLYVPSDAGHVIPHQISPEFLEEQCTLPARP